jgi:integrase
MLFDRATLDAIADGSVTVAFRRWRRPTVTAGGTLTTAVGVLAIDEVEAIDDGDVTKADARAAGRSSVADLLSHRGLQRDGQLYRVRFHLAGEDPRISLREQAELSEDEVETLTTRLERYDRSSRHGPWTRATLELIDAHPGLRAADLATQMPDPQETQAFKTDVRKLKALGLTESLEVGYRLSPRGAALLGRLRSS